MLPLLLAPVYLPLRPNEGKEVKLIAEVDFYHHKERVDSLLQEASISLANTDKLVLTTIALFSQVAIPHYKFSQIPVAVTDESEAKKSDRMVCLAADQELVAVPVYDLGKLTNGHEIMGPAIIESEHTTVYVASAWRASIDHLNNAVLEGVLE